MAIDDRDADRAADEPDDDELEDDDDKRGDDKRGDDKRGDDELGDDDELDDDDDDEPEDRVVVKARAGGEGDRVVPLERPARLSFAAHALRYLFYSVWLFAVPLALSLGGVRLLTPRPYDEAGMLRTFVREQQVPATIVFFTLFAMVLWRFRYLLPLAGSVGGLTRSDVPARLRARFDDALQLLDEAQRIMRLRERELSRALNRKDREQLDTALTELEASMAATPLEEPRFDEALVDADRVIAKHLSRWRKGELREYAESIGVAVAVALVLRFFVIEAFKIPSGSMIPTLMIGDHIFVAKYAYGPLLPWTDARVLDQLPPERGDVMVFKFPENKEQDFIKRLIALPGDKLEVLDGRPVLNGWAVPHCYVGRVTVPHVAGHLYLEHLGERSYLTMYDNRPGRGGEPCARDRDCGGARVCRAGACGLLQGPYHVARDEVWVMGDNRDNSHDSRSWRGGLGNGVPFENIKGRAMFVWMSWNPSGGVAYDRLFVNVMGPPKLPPGAPPDIVEGLRKCERERPPVDQTTPPAAVL